MLKKLLLWCSALLILIAAGGCGDSATAEKRLSNDLNFFADQYIRNEFAKQIKLNEKCKAFLIRENKLLLLGFDGIDAVARTQPHKELHEFVLSRYYVGQELTINCKEASWSGLTKVNHDKFSYRALVTFKLTDLRRMWQHTPGNTIVLTAFKNNSTADQLKFELLNKAVNALPDERFDFCSIYSRSTATRERNFTVSFFVCYDPSVPGWIPEDPELAGEIKVNAVEPDWLDCSIDKFKPASGMELYKNDFYWNNSKRIRMNYDSGLVFRYNQWMPLAQAEETAEFDKFVKKFDPDQASIDQLTGFLQRLKGFSAGMNFSAALQKAVRCAENQINNLRNVDNYQGLESFLQLMQNNKVYSAVLPQVQDNLVRSVKMVKRRINRKLDETVNEIKASLQAIMKLNSSREYTALQINIECVRQDNLLKKLCPEKSMKISDIIFQIRFLLLVKKRDIDEVNKLYRQDDKKDLLVKLEKAVLKKCQTCRRGMQKCIYCEKSPGICSECKGKRSVTAERCSACKGNGICAHCKGSRSMKCMNCQGRGFVIIDSKNNELCQQLFKEFEDILTDNITDQENKKLQL